MILYKEGERRPSRGPGFLGSRWQVQGGCGNIHPQDTTQVTGLGGTVAHSVPSSSPLPPGSVQSCGSAPSWEGLSEELPHGPASCFSHVALPRLPELQGTDHSLTSLEPALLGPLTECSHLEFSALPGAVPCFSVTSVLSLSSQHSHPSKGRVQGPGAPVFGRQGHRHYLSPSLPPRPSYTLLPWVPRKEPA